MPAPPHFPLRSSRPKNRGPFARVMAVAAVVATEAAKLAGTAGRPRAVRPVVRVKALHAAYPRQP